MNHGALPPQSMYGAKCRCIAKSKWY